MSNPNPPEPRIKVAAARQLAEDGETNRIMRDAMHDLIKKQVMSSLGVPNELLQVQVRPVGTNRYRANIFVGNSITSARIANSFFLSTDGDGNILSSSPKIAKSY